MITDSKETDTLLHNWIRFREALETIPDPLNKVSEFFLALPSVKVYTDPYDKATWPTPWELITENQYCRVNLILGICYTLQLTERFSYIKPTIQIAVDSKTKTVYYILCIGDNVFGFLEGEWVKDYTLPKSLKVQKIFEMESLH